MKNEKLGQEQAFASSYDEHTGFDSLGNKEYTRINELGMSKRFYAACAAMQGILSTKSEYIMGNRNLPDPIEVAKYSFACADELLKQENE